MGVLRITNLSIYSLFTPLPMLSLSRTPGQSLVIDGRIRVTYVRTKGGKATLHVDAPSHVAVDREEVHLAKQRDGRASPADVDRFRSAAAR